ncbi:MAG: TonB-dependent receptor [Gemmatimonadetes bacterium]|uniref:TonB-dependent receptor n=1 Tax=Candidatus Kutchimonas denitrificans TaxID=3056748 RepID=A0AAE5CAS2_9BACT|nr:TonB-dependent receptor [Gemmatimonadota bacterium]NIR73620.1 TonB-dependent receptor [Candidatus Kutchimonas denitrificans]NIR99579.1 TonB-dependent receptor [Gemmatimonadota bacterium]NIT65199.1 TonB-dependent receptor [Gemmatimonadota bacterium]NIV23732.1 TonB-dependent receptor [Gemmatimonadota bacterium]
MPDGTTLVFLLAALVPQTPEGEPQDTPVVRLETLRVEISRLAVGGVEAARLPFLFSSRSHEEIRAASLLTLADALDRLPGVHANDELGAAAQPDITVRGFSVSPVVGLPQSLSVFVDGVRVNEPDAAQVHFDLIPLDDVERIDLIRGPMGPFGRNTLAGAINILTRRGGGETQAELELTGGSFGTVEGRGQASGALGALDYYASGRYVRSDGWRDVTAVAMTQLFAKAGRRGERSDLWISYRFAADSIEQAGSLPASWLAGSLPPQHADTDDPRVINFTGGDYFRPRLHFVTGNYAVQLTPTVAARANAFYRQNDIEQFNANISEANSRGLSHLWSAGVATQLSYAPRPEMLLLAGLEYVRDDVEARIFAEPNAASADSGLTTHVTTAQDGFGAFAQVWWTPGIRFSVLGSLRYDLLHVPFRDLLEPSNNGDNTFRQLTASLGTDFVLSSGASLYASYGHGFRAPVILELACADPDDPCPLPFELGADPPLDPVVSDTWQAGFRWIASAALRLELAGYWSEIRDEIFNVVAPPTTRGFFQNLPRTRRQGVELQAEIRPVHRLTLHGDLSYTRATFQSPATLSAAFLDEDAGGAGDPTDGPQPPSVEPGDHFPLIPELSGNLRASYATAGWTLSVEGSYTGSQWLRSDEDNTLEAEKLDAYALLSLYGQRTIGPATLYIRVENLLDARYSTFGVLANNPLGPGPERVEPFLTPGAPRSFFVGARWRW